MKSALQGPAAWTVVEKLGSVDLSNSENGKEFIATFYYPQVAVSPAVASAPLAICLAALRAVGHEVKG